MQNCDIIRLDEASCAGLTPGSTSSLHHSYNQDVDGRDKPGHDGGVNLNAAGASAVFSSHGAKKRVMTRDVGA